MEFRTRVDVPKLPFQLEPLECMLFVGSCFADSVGRRFQEEHFRATVNPYGVMYNPASILHTVERWLPLQVAEPAGQLPRVVFLTLGTNHVYRLRETGEIVDNCQKRPAALFQEEELTVDDCQACLQQTVELLRRYKPDVHVVLTVSPIRYRKYGYHGSQLSKATLLLAADAVVKANAQAPGGGTVTYFPAYELVLDELRDYRFYKADMLHPSEQAVEYIWQQLVEQGFSPAAKTFLQEWAPVKAALAHRPFNPDSQDYRQFLAKARADEAALLRKYE